MDGMNVCARLIEIYNQTQENTIDVTFGHMKEDYENIRKATDKAINQINFKQVPDYLRDEWMMDKLAYVTWTRDMFVLNENKN